MLVLYIIGVLSGVLLPFLAEKTEKDRIISCCMMLGDLFLIAAMAYSDIAYFEYLGKSESVAIAACLMLLSIAIKKMQILTDTKHVSKTTPKTHHQKIQQSQNHKAAS